MQRTLEPYPPKTCRQKVLLVSHSWFDQPCALDLGNSFASCDCYCNIMDHTRNDKNLNSFASWDECWGLLLRIFLWFHRHQVDFGTSHAVICSKGVKSDRYWYFPV